VFKFITKQHFLVNLIAAIALVVLLMFGFLQMLGLITHHGAFEKVPSVTGMPLTKAIKTLEDKGFEVEVQDSVYVDSIAPLNTVRQSPLADAMVKSNRTIYLTVNRSQPPQVDMPNLVGFSFRNAQMYLAQLGLRLGDTIRRPDIAKDAVLEQTMNGQPVGVGAKVFMGSTISFVLGDGLGENEFTVPDLMGMTFTQAKATLKSMNLNVGGIVATGVRDTANAFIYKQYPMVKTEVSTGVFQTNTVREGQGIDLYLSVVMPIIDSTATETPLPDAKKTPTTVKPKPKPQTTTPSNGY
jgi:beta-lactam-binding protein with PASTA domain